MYVYKNYIKYNFKKVQSFSNMVPDKKIKKANILFYVSFIYLFEVPREIKILKKQNNFFVYFYPQPYNILISLSKKS